MEDINKPDTNKPVTQAPSANCKIAKFSNAYTAPDYIFKKAKKMVLWGKNNLEPNFLLELFNSKGGVRHKAIIEKKVKFICGQGFEPIVDPLLQKFVDDNNLIEEVKKVTTDYEIFNGFSWEVVWTNDGTKLASIQHQHISQCRFGLLTDEMFNDYFWYSKNWADVKKYAPTAVHRFNQMLPIGNQMTWYCEYNPENILVDYPIPSYSAAINAIMTDHGLDVFNLNQVDRGFFPSFGINFATGIPPQEEQDRFADQFEEDFMGPENTAAVFITYTDPNDGHEPPLLQKIDLNDSDKRFESLTDRIENNLVTGSQIPPQMVILTEGKLGSTEERAELMVEFQKSYVAPRQAVVERELNRLLAVNGFEEKLVLKKYNT